MQDRCACLPQEADAADHFVPVLGVELDDPTLLGSQRPLLAQQPGGDAQLADVMQDAREAQNLQPVVRHPQFTGDEYGGPAHPFAVPAGVAVLDVHGLDEGPDRGLMRRTFPVVLSEDPARDVHGQQHQQGGDRPVRAAPQHRHHQSDQAVHEVRRERPELEAAPGHAGRAALGGDEHAAVEGREHHAEGDRGSRCGHQDEREVGRRDGPGAAEAGQSAEQPPRGVGGDRERRRAPDPAQPGRRLVGPPGERTGDRHERRGSRWQQEGGREEHRDEGSHARGSAVAHEGAAGQLLAHRVEGREQEDSTPGRVRAAPEGGDHAGAGGEDGAQDVRACGRRDSSHGAPSPRSRMSGSGE